MLLLLFRNELGAFFVAIENQVLLYNSAYLRTEASKKRAACYHQVCNRNYRYRVFLRKVLSKAGYGVYNAEISLIHKFLDIPSFSLALLE